MRRSLPLRRRTPLRPAKPRPGAETGPRSPLARRTRLRPVNPERRERLRQAQYGHHATWIVTLPCSVPRCRRRLIDPAHARSRGAGGKAEHLVPLCRPHHDEQHQGIKTFESRYGLDLLAIAARLWERSPANREEIA